MEHFTEVFRDYLVDPESIGFYNIGWKFVFKNGYGASVITGGYGNKKFPYEVAVLEKITDDNYALCFDTQITDDVIGYLDNEGVIDILNQIKELKEE